MITKQNKIIIHLVTHLKTQSTIDIDINTQINVFSIVCKQKYEQITNCYIFVIHTI